MKALKKILFPTDFSEMANGAFDYAQQLGAELSADIEVLNVYRGDFGVPVPEVMAYEMLEARRKQAEENLNILSSTYSKGGVMTAPLKTSAEMGLPVDVIIDQTKRNAYDLVVMGTKGEHNIAEVVMGSVSTAVIGQASCAVMVIPEGAKYRSIKKIAYATNLVQDSVESVAEVVEIANIFGADLFCVHINTKGIDDTPELEAFDKLLFQHREKNKITLIEMNNDTISEGLNEFITNHGIDLLVMYRPQRGLFERLFHRSVTKQVAFKTTVPLLVFKK